MFQKRKLNLDNYKNSLETTQLNNNIKNLEKNKINIDSLKTNHNKFIRNNKSVLKTLKDLKVKGTVSLLNKLIKLD